MNLRFFLILCTIIFFFSCTYALDTYWKPNGNAYGHNNRGEYGCGLTSLHEKDGDGVLIGGNTFTTPPRLYFVLVDSMGKMIADYTEPSCSSKVKCLQKTNHDKQYIASGWIMKNGMQQAYMLKIKITGSGEKRKIEINRDWGTDNGFAYPGGFEYWDIIETKNPNTNKTEYVFCGETGYYPELFLIVGKINSSGTKVIKKWIYTKDNPLAKTKLVNYSTGLSIVESYDRASYYITGGFGANVYYDRSEDIYDLDYFYSRAFLLKIDTADGKIDSLWQTSPEDYFYLFNNEKQPQLSIGYDLAVTENHELLVSGSSKGKIFLQKFDKNGHKLWKMPKIYDKEIPGEHKQGNQVHYYQDNNGKVHYIIAGYLKETKDVNANRDVLCLKVNQQGDFESVTRYGYKKYPKRWDDGISVNDCSVKKVCLITPQ